MGEGSPAAQQHLLAAQAVFGEPKKKRNKERLRSASQKSHVNRPRHKKRCHDIPKHEPIFQVTNCPPKGDLLEINLQGQGQINPCASTAAREGEKKSICLLLLPAREAAKKVRSSPTSGQEYMSTALHSANGRPELFHN